MRTNKMLSCNGDAVLSYGAYVHRDWITRLLLLSRPRRPHRSSEWNSAKAVTFIVTLAATRSVTRAARETRMSRKAAYALKARDPAFASAWAAAMNANRRGLGQGDKVEEVEGAPVSPVRGSTPPSRIDRERALVQLVATLRESPPLAHCPPAQ